eukprot:8935198-Pyramimonas_sp.AAC.1
MHRRANDHRCVIDDLIDDAMMHRRRICNYGTTTEPGTSQRSNATLIPTTTTPPSLASHSIHPTSSAPVSFHAQSPVPESAMHRRGNHR